MVNSTDPKQRFSNRVANYVKYRPTYPQAVLDCLRADLDLTPAAVVADIGAGTGILTELFLKNGNPVFAVEPNRAMREAAEQLLQTYPNFHSVDGSAEATTLAAHSVNFVTAGQSFHWFSPAQAQAEFRRILQPGGWVVLIWNSRRLDSTPLMQAYEQMLLDYAADYRQVRHHNVEADDLQAFFVASFGRQTFENSQLLDYEALQGRTLSASYVPLAGQPNHEPLQAELRRIFEQYQTRGQVRFEYDTEVYYGQLG